MGTVAATTAAAPPAKWMSWIGWGLTTVVVLFLAMDGAMKFMDLPQVRAATGQLGWPTSLDRTIGAIEAACLVLYAVPRTAVLGAILITGLLGGAIAAHLRVNDPLFSHTLFGVYVGLMTWGGLWLRDARLRALMPVAG